MYKCNTLLQLGRLMDVGRGARSLIAYEMGGYIDVWAPPIDACSILPRYAPTCTSPHSAQSSNAESLSRRIPSAPTKHGTLVI